jgi:hypothetical protein
VLEARVSGETVELWCEELSKAWIVGDALGILDKRSLCQTAGQLTYAVWSTRYLPSYRFSAAI